MKSFAILILVAGILFCVAGYYEKTALVVTQKEYILKYIPRTFAEEQIHPVDTRKFFASMFGDQEPFMNRKMI